MSAALLLTVAVLIPAAAVPVAGGALRYEGSGLLFLLVAALGSALVAVTLAVRLLRRGVLAWLVVLALCVAT